MELEQGFEEWWNRQPISKVAAPHMELIQQSYKDLCLQAWIASRSDLKSRMDSEGLTKVEYTPSKIKPQEFSTDSQGL